MNKQTKAIHKALKVLNCLNNDRVYETAWVKGAINACEKALEQPAEPRLVSYALDGSTCTLNIDGEEVYFNREQPAQEPVSDDEIMNIWLFCEGKVAGLNETGFDCKFPVIFSRALLEFINAKQ